jgi:hypothetical protein
MNYVYNSDFDFPRTCHNTILMGAPKRDEAESDIEDLRTELMISQLREDAGRELSDLD